MSDTVARALTRLSALAFGLVWGFFVAFNVVFSDIFGAAEMLGAIAYVLVAYFVLGLAFGTAGPKTGLRFIGWLSAPGTLFVLLMLGDNPSRLLYTTGVFASVIGGTFLGVWLGAIIRKRVGGKRRHHEETGGAAPAA